MTFVCNYSFCWLCIFAGLGLTLTVHYIDLLGQDKETGASALRKTMAIGIPFWPYICIVPTATIIPICCNNKIHLLFLDSLVLNAVACRLALSAGSAE